jgi:hypothetical protein
MALWAWLWPRDEPAAPAADGSALDKTDPAEHVPGSTGEERAKVELMLVMEKAVSGVMEETGLWEAGRGAYKDNEFAALRFGSPTSNVPGSGLFPSSPFPAPAPSSLLTTSPPHAYT